MRLLRKSVILFVIIAVLVQSFCIIPPVLAAEEIIIDDGEIGHYESGTWSESTTVKGYNNTTTRISVEKGAYAQWTPELTQGEYQVFIYMPVNKSSDNQSKIEIVSDEGVATKILDYTQGKAGWFDLGKYMFASGIGGYVRLYQTTEGKVARADAVKFTRVGDFRKVAQKPVKTAVKSKSTEFIDVQNSVYQEAVKLLADLEIIDGFEDGTYRPEKPVTRADFSAIVIKALGLDSTAKADDSESVYEDVPDDYWACQYIQLAVAKGIIKGYADDTFKPDDTINYNEAVKMLVSALGYDVYARQKGGYPEGYLWVASSLGISDGVAGGEINRGIIAQMMYDALHAELLNQTGFGYNAQYEVSKDKTWLTEKLEIQDETGLLTANGDTSLTGTGGLAADKVKIGDEIYRVGKTNAKEYLGYKVKFYYKEDSNGENVLVSVQPARDNEVLIIQADDIEEVTDKYVSYWKDKVNDTKTKKAAISNSIDLIYNGKARLQYSINDLKPSSGELRLIDNNSDGRYDVLFVTAYDIYVVDRVITSNYKVYDKYGMQVLTLDPQDPGCVFSIMKDGKSVELKDLKEWDVLSVAQARDQTGKEVINIQVRSLGIKGTVSEKSGDDKVVIDNKEYEIAYNYRPGVSNYKVLNLDTHGTFYLDIYGKIAGADIESNDYHYGYLFKVVTPKGLNNSVKFKLFSSSGEWLVLESADKIEYNESGNRIEAKKVLPNLTDSSGNTVQQLITYYLDGEGKIDKLSTARDSEDEDVFRKTGSRGNRQFRNGNNSFKSEIYIDENTIILNIPNDNIEESFSKKPLSFLEKDEEYEIQAYDADEFNLAPIILIYTGSTEVEQGSLPLLVDKISKAVDGDGKVVQKLYGLYDTQATAFITDKDDLLQDLARGDVIQFDTNSKGEINNVNKLFDYSQVQQPNPDPNMINRGQENGTLQTTYGEVIACRGDRVTVRSAGTLKSYKLSTRVYLYDLGTDKVSLASTNDIAIGDMLYIHMRSSWVRTTIIYRK